MKKTKIIVPALGLLLLSTAASVTGTVAWFSMNNTVTVSGAKISANSNATYLLISNSNTGDTAPENADAIQAENAGAGFTSLTLSAEPRELFPVAPASAFTAATFYQAGDSEVEAETKQVGDVKTHTAKTDYVAGSSATDPVTWYTMIGTDATSTGYVGRADTEAAVSSENLSNYVLKYTFYFTIADGANNAANLVVDSYTITNTSVGGAGTDGVKCLVVGTNGSVMYNASTDTDSLVLETTLNSTTVYSVRVYIYYDGNDSNIYTNNIPNIDDFTIDLKFGVTAA